MLAAVDRIEHHKDNTNTTGGLRVARMEVFERNEERPDVHRIIVLITDGVPTAEVDLLQGEVNRIRDTMDIRILGLGVTEKVSIRLSI